jgi:hypothetical protein
MMMHTAFNHTITYPLYITREAFIMAYTGLFNRQPVGEAGITFA